MLLGVRVIELPNKRKFQSVLEAPWYLGFILHMISQIEYFKVLFMFHTLLLVSFFVIVMNIFWYYFASLLGIQTTPWSIAVHSQWYIYPARWSTLLFYYTQNFLNLIQSPNPCVVTVSYNRFHPIDLCNFKPNSFSLDQPLPYTFTYNVTNGRIPPHTIGSY